MRGCKLLGDRALRALHFPSFEKNTYAFQWLPVFVGKSTDFQDVRPALWL